MAGADELVENRWFGLDEMFLGKTLRQVFAMYDTDGSGAIGPSELSAWFDHTADAGEEGWQMAAAALDMFAGGDSVLDFHEFCELWNFLHADQERVHRNAAPYAAGHQAAGASPPTVDDEVVAAFNRFNLNGDDKLDEVEIQRMLETANYDVDRNYVQGLAQLLGDFDADGSGGIELAEFQVLWKQLDLKPRLAAADRKMRMAFDKYNTNGDGMLDKPEIEAMLRSVNFEFDSDYIEGLAQLFGRFDVDGSGGIELAEFRDMWDQLGLAKYMDDEDSGTVGRTPQDDKRLARVVTRPQAAQRGRQIVSQGDQRRKAVTRLQAAERGRQVRSEIEQQTKAATHLQAAERGRQTRSKVAAHPEVSSRSKKQPVEADRLRVIFARADRNGDGILTRSELIHRLRNDAELARLLQLPQHIGDGSRNVFEAAFQSMDRNDDRSVTAEEFVTYMLSFMQRGPTSTRQSAPEPEPELEPLQSGPQSHRDRHTQLQTGGSPQHQPEIGATVTVAEKNQLLARIAEIRREDYADTHRPSTMATPLRPEQDRFGSPRSALKLSGAAGTPSDFTSRNDTAAAAAAAATAPEAADVLIQDSGSAHDKKVGKLLCHTPSGRFALVQFPGERSPRPVPVSSCRFDFQLQNQQQDQEHPQVAAIAAPEQGTNMSWDRSMSAISRSAPSELFLARGVSSPQTQRPSSSMQSLQPGDSVVVTDPSSARCGDSAVVVTVTPSGRYLTARFADTGTPRSFNRKQVVSRTNMGSISARSRESGSGFSRTLSRQM